MPVRPIGTLAKAPSLERLPCPLSLVAWPGGYVRPVRPA
jgi:hypothetical protein